MRRLDDGSLLDIDTILDALKQLDGDPAARQAATPRLLRRGTFDHAMRLIARPRRGNDDDHDPPPCPAAACVVPRLLLNLADGDAAMAAAWRSEQAGKHPKC